MTAMFRGAPECRLPPSGLGSRVPAPAPAALDLPDALAGAQGRIGVVGRLPGSGRSTAFHPGSVFGVSFATPEQGVAATAMLTIAAIATVPIAVLAPAWVPRPAARSQTGAVRLTFLMAALISSASRHSAPAASWFPPVSANWPGWAASLTQVTGGRLGVATYTRIRREGRGRPGRTDTAPRPHRVNGAGTVVKQTLFDTLGVSAHATEGTP